MTIFKLRQRIKSLEDYLGVYYEKSYDSHEDKKWSEIEKLKERVKAIEGKKK